MFADKDVFEFDKFVEKNPDAVKAKDMHDEDLKELEEELKKLEKKGVISIKGTTQNMHHKNKDFS